MPRPLSSRLVAIRRRRDAQQLRNFFWQLDAGDKDQVNKWTALGGRTFAHEARLRDAGKEAVVLTFPAAMGKDITATLRQAGFRFSKVLQHWEGLARFDEAESLATAHGGTARRVAATVSAPQPQAVAAAAAE